MTRPCAVAALLFVVVLAPAALAAEESAPEEQRGEEERSFLEGWLSRVRLGAFVDVYGALNANLPPSGESFFPGAGSTAKAANTLGLNLAGVDVTMDAGPVGARLQLVAGSATAVVHSGETKGTAFGPDVYNPIYEAYVTWRTPLDGLVLDAGVYSSHIGFESFFSQDNWTYTRGWMAELSPYYQAGVRATYTLPFLPELSAQLHVLNGWQLIVDNNLAKSLGAQVAWTTDALVLAVNGWAGPEGPDDDDLRLFGDVVVLVRPLSWLSVAGSADVGYDVLPDDDDAFWWAAAMHGRVAPLSWLAVAARLERFEDFAGAMSGTAQALTAGTLTLELRPVSALIFKLEGRYDISTADVFEARGPLEETTFSPHQGLVVASVVGSF